MPEVNNCCCCISLRDGTITFGVLNCIASFIPLIESGIEVIATNDYPDDLTPEEENSLKTFSLFSIVFFLIYAFLSISMTWGAVQRKTGILEAWIVILSIGIVVGCIIVIVNLFLPSGTNGENILGVTQGVFAAYQLLVVHSYRQEIFRERKFAVSC